MWQVLSGDVLNLVRHPWLPVRRRSGAAETIAPWQITERIDDDPFVSFAWPRPDFNGAAYEFLIGLLSTAAAPGDEAAWEDWWESPPAPEVLRERLDGFAHAFDLDGPGPRFMQDLDPLEDAEDKGIAALLIDAPGAQTLRNNADLFVKRGGAPVLGRAAAAMALYTLNAYAPSGGAGHRTSLRGGGPLTTLIVSGDTLWCRLWPNVETDALIADRSVDARLPSVPAAIFPWLGPTRTSNPKAGGRPTAPGDVHPLQAYWGMPRRIRLVFEEAAAERCGLTGLGDAVIVRSYRTRNYGIDYSEGFLHPLTPYYAQKVGGAKLPVHPQPGGISYRHWPGIVVETDDKLRDPAQTIRHACAERRTLGPDIRFAAFGYDMDNMKARAWVESEMPLLLVDDPEVRGVLEQFIRLATKGADRVARLLVGAVKSALNDKPSEAPGDYSFIAERFWRDTEQEFYAVLEDAWRLAEGDSDDPTYAAREDWAHRIKRAALRLFDDCAPADGLEDRDMHRHVKARFYLVLALSGHGKEGRLLFDGDLGIVSPETSKSKHREDAA